VSRYQKGKTNLDLTQARDSEWQWHQLGHMQACTSLQTDNHTSTPPFSFFTGRMPFLLPNQQRQSTEGTIITLKCGSDQQVPGRGSCVVIPDQRLVVQVPDGDVAVAAAAETHLGVGTHCQRVACRCRRRQLRLHTRRRLRTVVHTIHTE